MRTRYFTLLLCLSVVIAIVTIGCNDSRKLIGNVISEPVETETPKPILYYLSQLNLNTLAKLHGRELMF